MYRLTLGDFELTAISDGTYHLDGGAFFGVVPKVMWERRVKADEKNLVPTGLNSVVVRTGDKTVLIETGIGNKLPDRMVKIYGQPAKLLDNLSAAGISPEDVDVVINTHLHFDHCGWNTRVVNGKLVPLDYELRTGDTVDILTSKAQGEGPSQDWLQFVKTPRARNKIRQWFSRGRREDAMEQGRDALQRLMRKQNLPIKRLATDEARGQSSAGPGRRGVQTTGVSAGWRARVTREASAHRGAHDRPRERREGRARSSRPSARCGRR